MAEDGDENANVSKKSEKGRKPFAPRTVMKPAIVGCVALFLVDAALHFALGGALGGG